MITSNLSLNALENKIKIVMVKCGTDSGWNVKSNQKKNGGTGAAILNAQEAENVNLLDEFDGFRLFVSWD